MIATVVYRANGAVAPACLPEYTHLMSNYYQQLNEILSQRCSAVNVNMNVSFINEKPQLLEDNLVQVLITRNSINYNNLKFKQIFLFLTNKYKQYKFQILVK